MDEQIRGYLSQNHGAAMITLRRDGTPHAVRIGIDVMGDKIWSSGTQARVRTKHLRRDPRSTLFVFDSQATGGWRWLTLECSVAILDGPDAPELNLRLFEQMQREMTPPPAEGKLLWYGQPKTPEEFLQLMRDEQRLIYEFTIVRSYGMYGGMPGR